MEFVCHVMSPASIAWLLTPSIVPVADRVTPSSRANAPETTSLPVTAILAVPSAKTMATDQSAALVLKGSYLTRATACLVSVVVDCALPPTSQYVSLAAQVTSRPATRLARHALPTVSHATSSDALFALLTTT